MCEREQHADQEMRAIGNPLKVESSRESDHRNENRFSTSMTEQSSICMRGLTVSNTKGVREKMSRRGLTPGRTDLLAAATSCCVQMICQFRLENYGRCQSGGGQHGSAQ